MFNKSGFGGFGSGSTGFGAASTPFGGAAATGVASSGFGSGFGSTATAAPTSGFGSSFGSAAAPSAGFGAAPATSGFGGFGATTAPATGFGSAPAFGAPAASTGGMFGGSSTATGTGFGNGASTGFGGFGAPSTGFGASSSTFGAPTAAPQSGFGGFGSSAPASSGFGGSFGSGGTASTFGGGAGFGQASKPFGTPAAATPFPGGGGSSFGGNTGFGAPSTGSASFGNGFGATTATSPFGKTPSTGNSMFGTASTPGFGTASASSPFGATTGGGFGSPFTPKPASTGFGATTPGFTSPSSFGSSTGSANGGTRQHPYRPTMTTEQLKSGVTSKHNLQVISAMNEYKMKTLEELRYEDYLSMKGGAAAQPTTGFGTSAGLGSSNGMFGGTSSFGTAPSTGSFGTSTNAFGTTNTGFGAPAGGTAPSFGAQPSTTTTFGGSNGFGTTPAPAFGASSTNSFGSAFGTSGAGTATTSGGFGFGSTAPSTAGFGTTPAFGATPAPSFGNSSLSSPTANSFGNLTSSFGKSAPSTPGFGQPTASFGSPSASSSFSTSTGFGTSSGFNTASTGFGTTPSGFGTSTGFGATSTGFGTAAPTGFGTGSTGFGAPSTGFGAPSTGFGTAPTTFGSPSASASGFGGFSSTNAAKPATSVGGFGFGTSTFGAPTNNFGQGVTSNAITGQNNSLNATTTSTNVPMPLSMDQKIDLLLKKKDEIISSNNQKSSEIEQETHKSAPSILFTGVGSSTIQLSRSSPSTHVKILPRGLKPSHAASKAPPSVVMSMISPPSTFSKSALSISSPSSNILIKGSAKKLVISSLGSPLPVMDELPLPPSRSAGMPVQTPLRTSDKAPRSNADMIIKYNSGEATGLTPSKGGTPIALRGRESQIETLASPLKTSKKTCVSPTVESESYRNELLPILTKEGYISSPSIAILQSMTLSELSTVKNFTVCRPDVGKIEWDGETDVRGLNLDEIIRIEHKEVFVYDEMVEPPEGEGLNKPATITLYDVFPKQRSDVKIRQFEDKLRLFCVENDAEFLSYDIDQGVWSFAVKHFSRYGLVDDDSEDEAESPSQQYAMRDSSMKENMDTQNTQNLDTFKQKFEESSQNLKQLRTILLRETSPAPRIAPTPRSEILMSPTVGQLVVLEQPTVPIDVPVYNPRPIVNPAFAFVHDTLKKPEPMKDLTSPDICTRPDSSISFEDKKKMPKKLLAFGRSFRVGWTADGKIVHPLMFGKCHHVTVEPAHTTSALSESCLESTFDTLLKASNMNNSSDLDDSTVTKHKFELARCSPEEHFEEYATFSNAIRTVQSTLSSAIGSPQHPCWEILKAVELINAVVGQEKANLSTTEKFDLMDVYEERSSQPEHWERRRVALSKWFAQLTEHEVVILSTPIKSLRYVFELLSVNKVAEAVTALETLGLFRLAMLVSQIGSDPSSLFLIRNQLELWCSTERIGSIDENILDLYILLGGMLKVEDAKKCILAGLGWRRALAMMYWYYGEADSSVVARFSDVLANFEELANANEVDSCLSKYTHPKDDKREIKDGLFSLLRIIFNNNITDEGRMEVEEEKKKEDNRVVPALLPEGYGRNQMDHLGVYIINSFLEGMELSSVNSVSSILLRNHVIAQLLSRGQWKWAIFVALQLPDEWSRESLVRDILNRFGCRPGWDEEEESNDQKFVVANFNVPPEWIHESTAICSGNHFSFTLQVHYHQLAGEWREAATVLTSCIVPSAMFHSNSRPEDLVGLYKLLSYFEEQCQFSNHSELMKVNVHNFSHKFFAEMKLSNIVLNYLTLCTGMIEDRCLFGGHQETKDAMDEDCSFQINELKSDLERLLEMLSQFHSKSFKLLHDNQDGKLNSMLCTIAVYAYKLLTSSELQCKATPSESKLFDKEILGSGYIHNSHIATAVVGSIDNFLCSAADCLEM